MLGSLPPFEVSRTRSFESVDNVTVTAVNGVPFTIRTMRIDRVLRGDGSITSIQLRELGDGKESTSTQAGQSYLLFAYPFEMTPGVSTGQWFPTGVYAGLYAVTGGTAWRLDPDSPSLPSTISTTAMDAQVS